MAGGGGLLGFPVTDARRTPASGLSYRRVVAAVVALALGGFAIGTTEFVTMGLLPDIADGIGVTIPSAGGFISAYALGVVVGAPVIAAFATRLPRRAVRRCC
jgi:DHA1 family inner membrane transport protein